MEEVGSSRGLNMSKGWVCSGADISGGGYVWNGYVQGWVYPGNGYVWG